MSPDSVVRAKREIRCSMSSKNKHIGSSFQSFLEEEGMVERVRLGGHPKPASLM
jgi:hypothetical protein